MNNKIEQREIFNSIKNKPYNTDTSIKILTHFLKKSKQNVINGYSVNLGSLCKMTIVQKKKTRAIIDKNELFRNGKIKELINSKYYDVSFKIKIQSKFLNKYGYVFKKGPLFKRELIEKINNDIVYYRKDYV